jgi:hypothetical protein
LGVDVDVDGIGIVGVVRFGWASNAC